MNFGLSEEQRMLDDALVRFIENEVPPARVREVMESDGAHDERIGKGLTELGIPGLLVPEEHGGSGLGLLDASVAARALGWGAVPAPFLGTAVLAVVALREAGSEAQQKEWLPRIAAGSVCLGVAATEAFSRREGAAVRVDSGRLSGKALFAVDSGAADVFLVLAGDDGLALVPRDADGLAIETLRTVDETRRVAELLLDGVEPLQWLGEPGAAGAVQRMLDAGRIIVASDILGACDRALAMSVAYAKERKQFGRVIGSFQGVKHMCAEMAAELEPARSLLWYAAHAFDAVPEEASQIAAHAKAHLAEVGTALVKTATEVHGGIGFTADYDLHLWFKRVGLDRMLLGTPHLLRQHAAAMQGL